MSQLVASFAHRGSGIEQKLEARDDGSFLFTGYGFGQVEEVEHNRDQAARCVDAWVELSVAGDGRFVLYDRKLRAELLAHAATLDPDAHL